MRRGTEGKIKLGISSCLLGEKVRYDGGHKLDPFLKNIFGRYVEWVRVCPEVESGLSVPREAMHLVGDPKNPHLITIQTDVDHTDRMLRWMRKRLARLEGADLSGFVLKSRSPSCGISGVPMCTKPGRPGRKAIGLFAMAFMDRFPLIPVEDEGRLHDPALRENFIERIFLYRRWQEFKKAGGTVGGLVSFHTDHKLLVMSHSVKHYTALGKLVANAKGMSRSALHENYFSTLMEGFRLIATVRKNTNVLQHMAGYFKDLLPKDEKQELQKVIANYHNELVPLIVPRTLIGHYVKKYRVEYLKRQYYLNPHPTLKKYCLQNI